MRFEPDLISKNIKRKKKIKKILFLLIYILLIPTILFSLFLIMLELGNSDEVPSFFDYELYNVISESMEPKLKIDDIIIVKRGYDKDKYKVGNIITFSNSKGELITHRIEKIITMDLEKVFITKGDNNSTVDEEYVRYENVIGKVVYTMPRYINILKNKIFFSSAIIILISIIVIDTKMSKKKLDRKMARERYEKKSGFYF